MKKLFQSTILFIVLLSISGVCEAGLVSPQLEGGGSSTFIDDTDTPSSYSGETGKVPTVNAGETALEFTAAGSGDVTSGSNITDNAIVRGDGGAKGIQETGIIVNDNNQIISGLLSAILRSITLTTSIAINGVTITFDPTNKSAVFSGSIDVEANYVTMTKAVAGSYGTTGADGTHQINISNSGQPSDLTTDGDFTINRTTDQILYNYDGTNVAAASFERTGQITVVTPAAMTGAALGAVTFTALWIDNIVYPNGITLTQVTLTAMAGGMVGCQSWISKTASLNADGWPANPLAIAAITLTSGQHITSTYSSWGPKAISAGSYILFSIPQILTNTRVLTHNWRFWEKK